MSRRPLVEHAMNPILEGIVTTRNADGTVNISPMGPRVDPEMRELFLRPFPTSLTHANLLRERAGVFHVTDDVEMLARSALDQLEAIPPLLHVAGVPAPILAGSCRWHAFEVVTVDQTPPRTTMRARVTQSGWLREFFGLHRARHAVVEAAILATRLHLASPADVRSQMDQLQPLVEKTAGPAERRAWDFLKQYVERHLAS